MYLYSCVKHTVFMYASLVKLPMIYSVSSWFADLALLFAPKLAVGENGYAHKHCPPQEISL